MQPHSGGKARVLQNALFNGFATLSNEFMMHSGKYQCYCSAVCKSKYYSTYTSRVLQVRVSLVVVERMYC